MGERVGGSVPVATSAVCDAGVAREALFQRLKPGPGHSPEQVVANQRLRLHGAMTELVAERGYCGVTVRELSRLAGVSTKSFYECFANVESCFVATYARIIQDALKWPTDTPPVPDERLRARLRGFFASLEEDPKAAGLVLVQAPSAGPALIAKARVADRALERFIVAELAAAANASPLPKALAHGAAAAALQLARSRLLSDRPAPAAVMADQFADWLLSLQGGCSSGEWGFEIPAAASADPYLAAPFEGIGDDRRFLVAAVTKLGVRDGFAKLTVPAICREAGVSRRTFDKCFDGVADCFFAAVETRIAAAVGRAERQSADSGSWERAVVRATAVLCAELRRDPALARLGYVDILAPGGPGLEFRERIFARWARRLRRTAPSAIRPRQLAAEASVAAAAAIATAGHREPVERTSASVAFVVLAPVIGPAAAGRVIATEMRVQTRSDKSKNI
jgi:AcrR family transcriptional regulator